jgi:pilus assembly protein CpaD
LRVVVERYVATGPKCPDWSQPDADRLTNELPSDFGCATAANLAAMAVDPHDLIAGRTMGPVVGDPASRPVAQYRNGEVLLSIGVGASSGAAAGAAGASSPSPPPGGGTSGP